MVKRILLALVTILIICLITFFVMHAVPGGPFNREKALSQATIDALNARYGLDKPLFTQFINYDALGPWRNFGGIRLENDILITKDGCEMIGDKIIPYHLDDVEAFISK